MLHVSLYSS